MDRPGRFDLIERDQSPIHRGGAEAPRHCAVAGPQAVDMAVGRTEEQVAAIMGRRRIDSAASVSGITRPGFSQSGRPLSASNARTQRSPCVQRRERMPAQMRFIWGE